MRIAAVLDNLDHAMRPPGGDHGAVAVVLDIQREDSHRPSGAHAAGETIRHADFP
ncbi:hypothetical protein EV648_103570 [Kribbella sp. VKM Ac-2568]|nr:hypothetical protein EV648_103570 [Kribbella sp. VKM Ac-2568]